MKFHLIGTQVDDIEPENELFGLVYNFQFIVAEDLEKAKEIYREQYFVPVKDYNVSPTCIYYADDTESGRAAMFEACEEAGIKAGGGIIFEFDEDEE